MKKLLAAALVIFALYFFFFASPNGSNKEIVFVVPKETKSFDVAASIQEKKLTKNKTLTHIVFSVVGPTVKPGGYVLRSNMDLIQIVKKLIERPDMVWVSINACLRKEQIGEILQTNLSWTQQQLNEWDNLYPNPTTEYYEGVYYPDTYLIPIAETPKQVSRRFINRFNEQFAPYEKKYRDANVRWVTGLKIASLIAREAAGAQDMRLISGIIWNRLNEGMPLQLDATMQYTAGKQDDGSWWGAIDLEEKQKDSPYNSYLHKGLPPTPICSPSIAYIDAVLNSEETDCFFYLHDRKGTIHCSESYEEHLQNIKRYLK